VAFLPYFSVRCVRLLRVTTASPFPRPEPFVFRPKSTSYDPSEAPTVPPHVGCVGRLFFSIGRPVDRRRRRRRRRRRATHPRPSVPSNPASTRARDEPDEPPASSSARRMDGRTDGRMDGLTNRWMPIRRRRVLFPSTRARVPPSRPPSRPPPSRPTERMTEQTDAPTDRPNARPRRPKPFEYPPASAREPNRTEPNRTARGGLSRRQRVHGSDFTRHVASSVRVVRSRDRSLHAHTAI
jgi:hypothetical protein